ncbi:valine--tRNA ligase [Engelhardtia mirabilis]|uniref:Valine--tRNA ligase n=1 Tax=Engelhardtia mirabilis TaxID=2528011 RepID=A0A518BPU0_9BACT|nr:Valine--tRNA ligase [Planctomycetes bacterium Pla133]QDV03312.1 Valine--tRNA ligase [Planctomycetes bacterium Pla86]
MELSPRYDPHEHEAAVYTRWLEAGSFTPAAEAPKGAEPFTIMIPPPNVTGVLHMGHALNGAIQDIVIRHKRMQGFDALWLPGTDHAGIATQAVVEKKLYAEEGKTRQDLGRDAFLGKVWEWKELHGNQILEQYRRLGASCDWSRTKFTMDEDLSRAVRVSFLALWEKGLIYRGARLVHWDCVLQTAISDDEIEYETRKGKLWHLKYPVKDQPERFLVVATTRPETMLGDTGVAVHPDDERYGDLVGKSVVLPFLGREIPIVADESVDPAFGTGAVKVTPGHDPADYERGARHNLPIISILEKDGTLNAEGGPFAGMSREKARTEVVKQLEELGLLDKVESITHNVSLSDRSKSVIEPLVSEQWFVRMKELAEPAIAAVGNGSLTFRPERWKKVYLDWLENVQDWCISRQLWWGHRIPIWYDEDGVPAGSADELQLGDAHPKTGKPIVRQDADVLDTWASSWLWPFATLGWPDDTADLRRFYPTQFISTAREIIYLWIARMVMAGYEFVDSLPEAERCPFTTCYVHATVLDGKGKRMSKSAGNGIDPIAMIEEFGADAVRYSLMMLTREGQDVKLAPARFEEGRRFTNKIWNAARFVMMNLEGERTDGSSAAAVEVEDRWILSRLARTRSEVHTALTDYHFNDAATALYRFVWNDFCDWYVELAKGRLAGEDDSAKAARGTLARVLNDMLALLHPFTPFQTEVLWAELGRVLGDGERGMLVRGPWPTGEGLAVDEAAEARIGVLQEVVRAVRSVRALTMVGERKALDTVIVAPRAEDRDVIESSVERLRGLAHLETVEVHAAAERPPSSAAAVAGGIEVFVRLGEDVDTAKLSETLARRADKARKGLEALSKKLANQGFLANAEPEMVEAEKVKQEELEQELALLERNLEGLS